jgi:6-phosphogluconate dehydrogenase (decarboxylating)
MPSYNIQIEEIALQQHGNEVHLIITAESPEGAWAICEYLHLQLDSGVVTLALKNKNKMQ